MHMSRDLSIQNLKVLSDKLHWRIQFHDNVVDGQFQSRVVMTPKDMDTITLQYSDAKDTKQKSRQAAADIGLLYFQRQPLTLLLGDKYHANDVRMDIDPLKK